MQPINPETFAARVKRFLLYTPLSKKQILRLLKCSSETLKKWANGEKMPNGNQLDSLKKLMGISHTDELNVPIPRDWSPATIEGCTIDEWRARALIAEQQLDRLQEELNKRKEQAEK